MWPFRNRDKEYLAEFNAWRVAAYPYDYLSGCETCITHHAVQGCSNPNHLEFIALVRDKELGLHDKLVVNLDQQAGEKEILNLGKFLLKNKFVIVSLRQIYDHLYENRYFKAPEPVEAVLMLEEKEEKPVEYTDIT